MADSSRDIESKAVDNVFTHESDAKADLSLGHDHEIREKYGQTKRGLTPRHVQLMAIGGSIGTGLFVGIGGVLATAGPLSVFLGYLFWGILFIWPANLCVAEMCAYLPIRGSIFELASRFIDPALGFAMGWTYFYAGVMLVCVEYSAVATIMQYWITDVNPAAWIAMAMAICVLLNVVAVKWYGEAEFVMASAKVILLIGLVLLTFITMVGGNPKGDAYGFRHWTNGNAMHSYYTSGATGRFLGWFHVVKFAGFTLGGPDFLALASGEIQNPRRTIPRVAKLVFYRLVGFYVIGVLAVGIICSSTDSRLLGAIESGAPGAAASPWVVGIMNMDIPFLPHIINFLVLTSGLSCGNAYLFSSSRTLYGLARDGQAPKFLLKCTKNGIPIYAVGIVSAITCITFLASSNSAVETLFWFIDLTATGLITSYTLMLVTFIGWYRARKSQGLPESSLHYIAPLTPWWPSLAILLGCLTLFFVGFDTIVPFDKQGFITSYFCLPYTAVLYFGWKLWKKTTLVRPKTADLFAGKAEVDEECREWEEGGIDENYKKALSEMGFWKRTWEKIW